MLIQPLTPEILEKRRNFRRRLLGVPGRFWRKTRRGIGWTLAIAFVAHSALNIYASMLLNRELSAIRQKGEPLQFSELAPPKVPDAQNAALVYKAAFDSLRLSKEEKSVFAIRESIRTPQQGQIIKAALRKNQRTLDLTRRAAAIPKCRFPVDYDTDNPLTLLFPHYGEIRELARLLSAQAKIEARNGDTTAALKNVRALFGLSHHLSNEPFIIGFLVAQAVDGITHQTLAQVLETVPLTQVQARDFEISLPVSDWNRAFQKGLLGERTFSLSIFDRLTHHAMTSQDLSLLGNGTSTLWASYPLLVAWRPALKMDEVQSLRVWKQMFDLSLTQRFSDSARTRDPISQVLNRTPRYAMMTRILFPIFARAGERRDRAEVQRRQREIALALAVYRTANARYPAQLAEIARVNGGPLPLDPYSQKPFVYRRAGKSFALYSIGANRVDNGAKSGFRPGSKPGEDDVVWNEPSR